jgi:hypothetical protein
MLRSGFSSAISRASRYYVVLDKTGQDRDKWTCGKHTARRDMTASWKALVIFCLFDERSLGSWKTTKSEYCEDRTDDGQDCVTYLGLVVRRAVITVATAVAVATVIAAALLVVGCHVDAGVLE